MGAEQEFERRLLHARHVRIGNCRLDRALNEVRDGERCTRLMPKAAAVLEVLVHFGGQPVSKERLLMEVWRGEFPTEDVITNAISQLRKAFGDGARESRYVRTVPRVGYALVAGVTPVPDAAPDVRPDGFEAMDEALPAGPAPPRTAVAASRAWLVLLLVLLVLALGAGLVIGGTRLHARPVRAQAVPPGAHSLPLRVTERRCERAARNFVVSSSELRRDEAPR